MATNKRWRRNPFDANTVNSVLITEEAHIIEYHEEPNAYGFYANEGILLDANDPVVLVQDNTAQTAFTEIPRTIAPSSGQFRVDYDEDGYYNTGFVQCNSSDNGKAVLFTYYGTGTILHPTFRLQTDFNYPGNINTEGTLGVTGVATFAGAVTAESGATIQPATTGGTALTVTGDAGVQGDVSLAENSGSTITVNNKKIEDVANGTASTDAANYGQLTNLQKGSVLGIPWRTTAAPISPAGNFYAASYANGAWVALREGSTTVLRSTDGGKTWAQSTPLTGSTGSWRAVAYGGGVWVGVAFTSPFANRSTDNGVTWAAPSTPPASNGWTDVAYGGGLFVAVANDGASRVSTSPDGDVWTARTAAAAISWQGVAYGNGLFVAVGAGGIMTSADGITWVSRTPPPGLTDFRSVGYTNGVFFAGPISGNIGARSLDGITWSAVEMAGPLTAMDVYYMLGSGGLFVALAGQVSPYILISPDAGLTWLTATPQTQFDATPNVGRIMTDGETFIAVATESAHVYRSWPLVV